MSAETQIPTATPEGADPVPPAIAEFQTGADQLRSDFSVEHGWTNGIKTPDGVITDESLATATTNLSEAATEDPAVLALVESVNAMERSARETVPDGQQSYVPATQRPGFALLKQYGATVPREQRPVLMAEELFPAKPQVSARQARHIGHQIIAGGHVIHNGQILPGRNEVLTPAGIVRTRETPRISL